VSTFYKIRDCFINSYSPK